jgi:kumamolisin
LPGQRQYLTQEQYVTAHGADPADLAKVEAFAQKHGLVVVETSAARRSDFFPLPGYQNAATVPPSANPPGTHRGRGVPDVAGDADPATGYFVRVDGQELVFGGTSAVAPLWAGLIALMNQKLGHPVGFLNPLLYGSLVGTGSFQDVTSGNNGEYTAKPDWDACTGWGSPIGAKLLHALGG